MAGAGKRVRTTPPSTWKRTVLVGAGITLATVFGIPGFAPAQEACNMPAEGSYDLVTGEKVTNGPLELVMTAQYEGKAALRANQPSTNRRSYFVLQNDTTQIWEFCEAAIIMHLELGTPAEDGIRPATARFVVFEPQQG